VPTYSGVRVSINLSEMARDDGYKSLEDYVYSFIEGGYADTAFSKSHRLYKKFLDWCEDKKNDDKDVPDNLWEKSVKASEKQLAKAIVELIKEIAEYEKRS